MSGETGFFGGQAPKERRAFFDLDRLIKGLQAQYDEIVSTTSTVSHSALLDLASDTHTQYALADGTRGNFEASGAAASALASANGYTISQVNAEAATRAAADTSLDGRLDIAETDITALEGSVATVSSGLAQELLDRAAGDSATLVSANSYTDTEVGAEETARIAADAAHVAALDPHPQYETAAEAQAKADAAEAAAEATAAAALTAHHDATSADHDDRYYTETEADARFINTAGDTLTGDLLGITPTADAHLTRKDYVDGRDALKVSKAGDTMSGALTVPQLVGNGGANQALNINNSWFPYVDARNYYSADGHVLRSLDGLTQYAFLDVNGLELMSAPTYPQHATRKDYVDTADAANLTAINNHINDTVDAHDATAISYNGTLLSPISKVWHPDTIVDVQNSLTTIIAEMDGRIEAGDVSAIIDALNAWTGGDPTLNQAGIFSAGIITADAIAAGAVVAAKIAASSIDASKIVASTITTTQIAANTIVAGNIAAGTITATEIAANTITAGQIAADAITTSELAAGAVTAGNIAAGTIVAADIAAGTITGDRLVAGTITATQIGADTITAGNIAANAITSSELAANSVVAGKIAAGTIVAADIAADTITGAKIAAGAITTAKLATDAITSTNYIAPPSPGDYAIQGSYLNLTNGDFQTPGFLLDGTTGDVTVRGFVQASEFNLLDAAGDIVAELDTTNLVGALTSGNALKFNHDNAQTVTTALTWSDAATLATTKTMQLRMPAYDPATVLNGYTQLQYQSKNNGTTDSRQTAHLEAIGGNAYSGTAHLYLSSFNDSGGAGASAILLAQYPIGGAGAPGGMGEAKVTVDAISGATTLLGGMAGVSSSMHVDQYGTEVAQGGGYVVMKGSLGALGVVGSNNGGIYFGVADASSGIGPTGAIEAAWGGANNNPHISIGVPRDGNKTRFTAYYSGQLDFHVADVRRGYITSAGWNFDGYSLTNINTLNVSNGATFGGITSYNSPACYGTGIHFYGSTNGGGSSNAMGLSWTGNILGTVDNVVNAVLGTPSDRRLKREIEDWEGGLDLIRQLRPKSYLRRDYELGVGPAVEGHNPPLSFVDVPEEVTPRRIGLIADEVEPIAPWAVTGEATPGTLQSVDYANFVVPLIDAVQELEARIVELENRGKK